jgi:hypothetical protein
MGIFDFFSKKVNTPTPIPTQAQTLPPAPKQPYTYMYPGSLFKFKNDIDGIYKIDIRENGGKVINPKIFYTGDGNYSPELLKAVDFKIQQQYEYNTRWRDSDGSSPWDNWVPGQPSIPPRGGGKRGRKFRKTRKTRKTRKARKSRKN